MMSKPNCPIIAIEEHYWDAELAKTYTGPEAGRPGDMRSRRFASGESGEEGERGNHTAQQSRPKYRKHPQLIIDSRRLR